MTNENLINYSKEDIDVLIKNSQEHREFYLSDSKGVYDPNSSFYEIDKTIYFFSKILKSGFSVKIDEEFFDFMKFTEVPRLLNDSIAFFDENNSHVILNELLTKYKLRIDLSSDEISETEFARMRKNREVFYPIITLYLGEKIKTMRGGKWEIEVDKSFFVHLPVIRITDQTLYPSRIAFNVFDGQINDLGRLLNLYFPAG